METNNKNGFFDLPAEGEPFNGPFTHKHCFDPEHNPPMHLYIPPDKGYRHKCPSCGKTTILIPPQIKF